MFKNYIKIAYRNIQKNKIYSFINITGLAAGFACCLLITLWVIDELSFDKFHKNGKQIYHVLAHADVKNTMVTPTLLGPTLKEEFPEVIDMARFHRFYEGTIITYQDRSFNEDRLRTVDPSFLKMFTFPFIKGDPETALENPHSIVITRATAVKYFAGEDPLGKILTLNHEYVFTVTGVIENLPHNSTLQFDMLVPIAFQITISGEWFTSWGNFFPYTFIKFQADCNVQEVNKKIADFLPTHGGPKQHKLTVLPFQKRHFVFYSDIMYVYIFSAIAVFILVIACLNFINLSTARSANRAKEIGMRKISGALRNHIIFQFIGESLIFSFIALIAAIMLVYMLLPFFNTLTSKEINLSDWSVIPFTILFTFLTGLAAGIYPAFFLSKFRPVKVLKGELKSGTKGMTLRKTLVVIQFSFSILLMIGMLVVHRQIGFIQNADIGYSKEQLVHISMQGGSVKHYPVFRRELLSNTRILDVTGTAVAMPHFSWHQSGFHWKGDDPRQKEISISYNSIDYEFVKTFQIQLVEGRDFSSEYATDATASCLINEEMMKLMELKTAEGAELSQMNRTYKIIGVVKNFHFRTFIHQIEPLVLRLSPNGCKNIYVRISPKAIPSTMKFIRVTWNRILPDYPFEAVLLDEEFEQGYRNIERTGTLLNSFALLAVIISCLGLFGLASFMAEQRTKEIGVRKVLGASVPGIILLISKEFTKWVLVANVIAWPVAWYVMGKWLQNFVYKTNITWTTFIMSAGIALFIALLTVSYQSIKAALANPVESLRYE